jgi:hypothetical protein
MAVPGSLHLPPSASSHALLRVADGPFGIKIKDHPNGPVVTPAVRESATARRADSGRFCGRHLGEPELEEQGQVACPG